MFQTGLYSLLSGNTALMATIAQVPQPVALVEQTAYPCLTYLIVTGSQDYTVGASQWQERLVQFDAWSNTEYIECLTVLKALRNLLDGYQGTLNDGTRVLGTFRENTIDYYEFDSKCYRIMVEYRFQIVEAA